MGRNFENFVERAIGKALKRRDKNAIIKLQNDK